MSPCILRRPTADDSENPLILSPGTSIRGYAALYRNSRLGAGFHVGHGALVRDGDLIGNRASIGSGVHVEHNGCVGARTRIQSGSFRCNPWLGDEVFVGAHVLFTDDAHPPCPRWPECRPGVVVKDCAWIGPNVVLLPRIVVGEGALVVDRSVATGPVWPGVVVAGNRAPRMGRREHLACPPPTKRAGATD